MAAPLMMDLVGLAAVKRRDHCCILPNRRLSVRTACC